MCACGGSCRWCRPAVIKAPESGHDWKPGDIGTAVIVTRGSDRRRVKYTGRKGYDWTVLDSTGGDVASAVVKDARPSEVVTICLDDTDQVERLAHHLARIGGDWPNDHGAVRMVLEAMTAPPKPDEPQGLGAVVEDADGERYVRHGLADDPDGEVTWCNSIGVGRSWARINAVRILSEGVQP